MQKILKQFIRLSRATRRWLPTSHTKSILGLFFAVSVIAGITVAVHPVKAADILSIDTIANGLILGATWAFLSIARLFLSLTVFFLELFINLAAYNDFIDAPPVVIGWLMVRDVANMFFVVVLLVIAFGTILGLEQYEFKKTLLKLVLAAIFINFSKLFLQLLIDVAHVFTTTFLNAIVATAGGNLINMFQMDKILQMSPRDVNLDNVGDDIRLDLFVAAIIGLIFSIMMTVIMGAYLIIMLMRIVVLWVAIILSPIAFIAQILPNTKSYAEEFWKEFTHHVLVAPVMVFFLWLTFATLGNGDISQVVAPNLSGADAQALASDLPANPTISLSEASTWENFASFLIAFGFLYVGLKQVEKLGVQGGEGLASAKSLGKKVAGYTTGYYFGRKALESVKDSVKDTAKDYGKLASGKIGLSKMPIFGSQRAGKIRRKAALARQEEYYKAREREIGAKGGGLAGALVTDKRKRATQEVTAAAAEKTKKGEEQQLQGAARSRILLQEENAFNNNFDAEKKRIADEKGIDEDKLNASQIKEARDKALTKTELMRSEVMEHEGEVAQGKAQGRSERLLGEKGLDVFLAQEREFEAKSKEGEDQVMQVKFGEIKGDIFGEQSPGKPHTFSTLNSNRQAEFKGLLSGEDREKFDSANDHDKEAMFDKYKAKWTGAEGFADLTDDQRDNFLDYYAKEQLLPAENYTELSPVQKDLFKNMLEQGDQRAFNLMDVTEKNAYFQQNKDTAIGTWQNRQSRRINLEKIRDAENFTDLNQQQRDLYITTMLPDPADQADFQAKSDAEKNNDFKSSKKHKMATMTQELKSIGEQGVRAETAYSGANDQWRAKKQHKSLSAESQQKIMSMVHPEKLANAKQKAAEGLSYFETFVEQGLSGQKLGKLKKEQEKEKARVGDIIRGTESKDPKLLRAFEETEIKEEMDQYARLGIYENGNEISNKYDVIKNLLDKQKRGEELSPQDMTDLKNASQNMQRLYASAVSRGWGHNVAKILGQKDKSFRNVDLNSIENTHKVWLGLSTATGFDKMDSAQDQSKIQEELRKRLREKGDILFRMQKNASDEAVNTHGQAQFYNLFAEGIDSTGIRKVGATSAMSSFIGQGNQLGTGSKDTGEVSRKNAIKDDYLPSFTINTAKNDGRAFVKIQIDDNGKEKVVGYVDEAMEKAMMMLSERSDREIAAENTAKLNLIFGGTYEKSSYEGNNSFEVHTKEVAEQVQAFLNRMRTRIGQASSPQELSRNRDAYRAMLKQLGVENDIAEKQDVELEIFTIKTRDNSPELETPAITTPTFGRGGGTP